MSDELILKAIISERVQEAMNIIKAKMAITSFTKEHGISRSALYSDAFGTNFPSASTVIALSKESGLSTDYILGMSDGNKWEKNMEVDDLKAKEAKDILKRIVDGINNTDTIMNAVISVCDVLDEYGLLEDEDDD